MKVIESHKDPIIIYQRKIERPIIEQRPIINLEDPILLEKGKVQLELLEKDYFDLTFWLDKVDIYLYKLNSIIDLYEKRIDDNNKKINQSKD